MKTKIFYLVIGYKFKSSGENSIDLLARYSSVGLCYVYLENNSWLLEKYDYYQIVESVTVRYGKLTDYCK